MRISKLRLDDIRLYSNKVYWRTWGTIDRFTMSPYGQLEALIEAYKMEYRSGRTNENRRTAGNYGAGLR